MTELPSPETPPKAMPGNGSAPNAPAASKTYKATIFADCDIPAEFGEAIEELEKLLEMQLWIMVQNSQDKWGDISEDVYKGFREKKSDIAREGKCGLLIHSPGGHASSAYKIVRLFQRRAEEFFTIVPVYAKSAATLMAIGGKEIVMGMDAELGPLDVQIYDEEKDDYDSALNAVQSLERLNAYALTAFDQAMQLFLLRINKKPDSLIPFALDYATSIVKPLVEKIDTIDLTRKSRELKEAQDYAARLMMSNYTSVEYNRIASSLVEKYSTHEFVVDRKEATLGRGTPRRPIGLGLHMSDPSQEAEGLFDRLAPHLERITVIGRLVAEAAKT